MKKIKFNPFIIPIVAALIGIGKYELDTYEAKKAEMVQANKYVTETVVDNPNEEPTTQVIVEETPVIVDPDVEEVEEEVSTLSSELLDSGYTFKNINFEELNNVNEEVIGWLSVDGVINDFPVVQTNDNSSYLRKSLEGEYSSAGTPFMDYRSNELIGDDSSISFIYGHHMKNGTGFADLCNYKKEGYVDEHPYGVYYSEDGSVYLVRFISGIVVKGSDVQVLEVNDMSEEEFNDYMKFVYDNSYFNVDYDLKYGDDLLALVTCSYETNNSRFILYGVLEEQLTHKETDSKTLVRK